jgi:hypothetical protein
MAKKKTAGPAFTSTPSTPPAAKRRAAPKRKTTPAADEGGASAGLNSDAQDTAAERVRGGADESAPSHAPTYDQIAEEAYHRYLSRGASHGADFDDWVEAERRLRERKK